MSVIQVSTIQNFIGLSTDTKPTTGVPIGSTFHAYDTGEQFVYAGDDGWQDDLRMIYALDQVINA